MIAKRAAAKETVDPDQILRWLRTAVARQLGEPPQLDAPAAARNADEMDAGSLARQGTYRGHVRAHRAHHVAAQPSGPAMSHMLRAAGHPAAQAVTSP